MFIKLFGSCPLDQVLLAARINETRDMSALDGLDDATRRRVAAMSAYLKDFS